MSKTIGVVMSLKDKVSPQVQKIAEKFKISEKEAKRLNATTNKLSKALREDLKGAAVVGGAALGALTTGAVALVKGAQDVADRIDDMSNKIGISRKGFQEWDYLLGQNGAKIESLQMGFKTLSKQIVNASAGNKTSAKIFKDLGINIYSATGKLKNQEQVFNELVNALQKMPEGAKKAKLANDLLGRSGSELMPLFNATNEQLARQREEYKKLGIEISDEAIDAGNKFGDSMEKIKSAAASATAVLGADLLPVTTELVNYLVVKMPEIRETIEPIFKGVASVVKFCIDHIKGLAIVSGITIGVMSGFKAVEFVKILIKGLSYEVNGVTVAQIIWNNATLAGSKILGVFKGAVGLCTGAVKLLSKTMLTNPLGIAITAAVVLIPLLISVVKNWDKITGAVKKAVQATKEFLKLDKKKDKKRKRDDDNVPMDGVTTAAPKTGIRPAVIKKAATGTQYSSGGATLVGEFGPEIRNLKKGDSITPARESARILSGGQNIAVNINIAGNLIGNSEFINQLKHALALELKTAMAIR